MLATDRESTKNRKPQSQWTTFTRLLRNTEVQKQLQVRRNFNRHQFVIFSRSRRAWFANYLTSTLKIPAVASLLEARNKTRREVVGASVCLEADCRR